MKKIKYELENGEIKIALVENIDIYSDFIHIYGNLYNSDVNQLVRAMAKGYILFKIPGIDEQLNLTLSNGDSIGSEGYSIHAIIEE